VCPTEGKVTCVEGREAHAAGFGGGKSKEKFCSNNWDLKEGKNYDKG
jgi:hypothetical protein